METPTEARIEKDRLKREAVWSEPARERGGQQCGVPAPVVILTSEEMGFSVTISYYSKGRGKNKELAMTLFELYLDEVIK